MTKTNKQMSAPSGAKNIKPTPTATTSINEFEIVGRFTTIINALDPRSVLDDYMIRQCLGPIVYADLTSAHMTTIVIGIQTALRSRGISIVPKEIEKAIREVTDKDPLWHGINCFVGEENNQMYILKKDDKGRQIKDTVSNFVLKPSYILDINNKDFQQRLYVFDIILQKNDGQKYTVKLTTSDFESMKELQARLKEQASRAGCMLHDVYNHMRGVAHRYIRIGANQLDKMKKGTSVLGYERLDDDGEKYFCSTNKHVYDMHGNISDDLEYVGGDSPNIDRDVLDSLTNLEYNKEKWEKEIMPTLVKNIMKLHTKDNMLLIAGWIAAVPHEYNVRYVFEAFPLLHIAGKQGAGKSTIIQALRQYMGYKNNTIPMFPTAAALKKATSVGYTIISTYDEYAGSDENHGWSQERLNATHLMMKSIYAKDVAKTLGKGEGGQGSFVYKIRNCMVSLGQRFITDGSIASRSVQIYVYDAFHRTEEGKQAKIAAEALKEQSDKNFWVGFNLWSMRQDDQDVKNILKYYEQQVNILFPKMGSRSKNVAATIMMGLHLFKKMAIEYGLTNSDIGYSDQDILSVPAIMADITEVSQGGQEESNILHQFIKDMANDGATIGNTQSNGLIFGRGQNVCSYKPDSQDPGKYDGKEACVFGQELVLVDIQAVCNHLNRKLGKDKYTRENLNVYIHSEFQVAKQLNGDGLVLAPNGYQIRYKKKDGATGKRRYTAFNKAKLLEIAPEYDDIVHDVSSTYET